MDETERPLRVPPQMSLYLDKHNIFQLLQSLLSSLVIDQPDDPINYLIQLLQRSNLNIPRVMLLGPPSVGKHTVAKSLSADLRAVHINLDSLLQDQVISRAVEIPAELLVNLIQQRLGDADCSERGWVLEGIPQTRLQALSLQQAGVIPHHVVVLDAPNEVLLERDRGKMVDLETGDVYHRIFMWPKDETIAKRLKRDPKSSEARRLSELHRFRREVTGLSSAYEHVLKVIDSDKPYPDIYLQALAFVRTRRYHRTPRVLLLGPPGSGKSHQAALLSQKYKMVDVGCGELLRSVAAEGTVQGIEVQSYLDDDRPVPDSLVLQVLEERLSRLDCSCRGWILHGFPRDLQQATCLQESQYQPNRVFFLEVTDDVCLERVTLRATDPVTGERYHAVTRPAPSAEVQERLWTRPEDSRETVTLKLSRYQENVEALQSMFSGAVYVNADQDPYSVFETVESRLTAD
ncbi:adenylate kinase 8 [Nelusetta ayraudi]|uniref:adenylate kinase 8 n=1 Tax=Nelusetta ayraudi TaxID=303726 RepID=UPI003F71D848